MFTFEFSRNVVFQNCLIEQEYYVLWKLYQEFINFRYTVITLRISTAHHWLYLNELSRQGHLNLGELRPRTVVYLGAPDPLSGVVFPTGLFVLNT